MTARSYQSKIRLAGWLAFAGAVTAGIVAGRIVRAGPPGEHFWIVFPLLVIVCALAFAACLPWWRRADDMQRSGQLISWYWGGSGGAAITLMAIVAATGVTSEASTGALYMILGQAAAFLLFWGGWYLRHRGPTS
jgi:hypothetical protein